MRPFFCYFSHLPADLRFALRCLCGASLILCLTLFPLKPASARMTASQSDAAESEAVAVSLDFTLCAFSDDLELELLARTLAAEVGDHSYAAQAAVGAALVNRTPTPRFPGELGAVIGDAGLRAETAAIPARSLRAAKAALMGVDPTQGAVYWGTRDTVGMITVEFDGIAFGK